MEKLSRNFDPTTGASKTIIRKKFYECELDYVTRKPGEWITEIKILRGDLRKLYVYIDESEIMTHIRSNLNEEYHTIFEILEDQLDDEDYPLTIESIRDKILVKFNE